MMMLVRPGFMLNIKKFIDLKGAVWAYSMWQGYLKRSPGLAKLKSFFEGQGVPMRILHTGGHASLMDLKRLAAALAPEKIVPVHSFHPEMYQEHFDKVCQVRDGEVIEV